MLKLLTAIIAFFFVFSANAADYTNLDLSVPVSDGTDYDNATIINARTLTSEAVIGAYVYLSGTVSGNVNITNNGSISSTNDNFGVFYLPNVGNTSSIKTVTITNEGSFETTGAFATTLFIVGKSDDGTRRSYDFSLNNGGDINSAHTGVSVTNGSLGSSTVINSGIISTTGSKAISFSGGATSTITNTGTIQAGAVERTVIEVSTTSSTITNSDAGSIVGIINANGSSSTSLTITNNTTESITGNITTSNSNLDVINTAGTITGNITLGNHTNSSLAINGGTVVGNVTMGNATQVVTFGGGILYGTINGAGQIDVNSNTVTNGHIGAVNSLTELTIADSTTFNALTNNNLIRATSISLGSNSVLTMGNGLLNGVVDGRATNQGTVNITFDVNSNVTATLGSTNGLAAVTFTSVDSAAITVTNSIKASEVRTSGIDGALILNTNVGITGNVIIGTNSNLLLGNNSFVSGTIRSNTAGSGAFQTANSGNFTASADIGTESFRLGNITVASDATLTTSYALRSNTISVSSNSTLTSSSTVIGDMDLASGAVLNLQNGATVNGTINPGGIVEEGVVNTTGAVTILGTIGGSGPIAEINVGSGSHARIGNNNDTDINTIESVGINITGQLELIDTTTINSNVSLLGSSSKINLSEHSHTINGNFTTSSGSRLYSTIHSTTAIDRLTVTGLATMNPNTKLSLTIGEVTPGSSYTIISGGIGSALNSITAANIDVNGTGINKAGRYIFTTEVIENNLILNMVLSTVTANNHNQGAVYDIIVNANTDNSGELYEMQEYLYGTATDTAKDEALNSVLPQVDNASNRIIFNTASTSLNLSSNRLLTLHNSENTARVQTSYNFYQEDPFITFDVNPYVLFEPTSSYNEYYPTNYNSSIWSQIFGFHSKQENNFALEGYAANVRGMVLGSDTKINKNLYVGLSGSYANSNIKSYNGLKNNNINSYQVNLYSGINLEKYFINNLIGFSWNAYESSRIIPVTGNIAKAQYSGQNYMARIEGGADFKLPYNYTITPITTFTAAHNSIDDYSENGAGTLNLHTTTSPTKLFEIRAGLTLKNKFSINTTTIYPEIFASYGYDFVGSQQKTSSNFIGQNTNFDSIASNPSRSSFKTGFGSKIFQKETFTLNLNYVFEKRHNYTANSAGLMASYKF